MRETSSTSALMYAQALLLRQAIDQLRESSFARRGLSNSSPSDFDSLILEASERYGVDPALVKAVIKAESGFNPDAVSTAGAKGLMQLMDETATNLGVEDSFDPAQNIEGGVRFLSQLLARYQDEALALAAYNAGPGRVDRSGGIPDIAETQTYVPRVLAYRQEFSAGLDWEA